MSDKDVSDPPQDTEAEEVHMAADEDEGSENSAGSDDGKHHDNAHHLLQAIGPAYARNKQFWMALFWSSLPQGAIMAFVALAFFNCYLALAKATWLNHAYEEALEYLPRNNILDEIIDIVGNETTTDEEHHEEGDILAPLRLGQGEWWYVALIAGAGFGVGLIKVVWSLLFPKHKYPKQLPSFLTEVRELQGHDLWLPIPVLACSALSIGMGASVGPEAALGFAGTALGSLLFSRRWRLGSIRAKSVDAADEDEEEDGQHCLSSLLPDLSQEPQLCALDGITGAFGALFPAQYLSGLMVHELGYNYWNAGSEQKFAHSMMETVARSGLSSSIAYLIFTALEDRTLLEAIPIPFAAYAILPEIRSIDMFYGLVLGILSGFVGLLGFFLLAIFGALGAAVNNGLNGLGGKLSMGQEVLGTLLTPAIGGAFIGLLCKAVPLLIGDGADQLGSLITLAEELGIGTMVATGFLKLVTVSISCGFGFVGGQIFPLIFTGTCMGVICHMLVEDIHPIISISSCMVAVPCAFVPAIFSMTTLASVVLALGGAATSPVFFACVASYTTVCGLGIVQDFIRGAKAAQKKPEEKVVAVDTDAQKKVVVEKIGSGSYAPPEESDKPEEED